MMMPLVVVVVSELKIISASLVRAMLLVVGLFVLAR